MKFITLHLSRSSHIHLFLSQQKEYLFGEFLLERKISCHKRVLVTIAKHGENLCHQILTLGTQEAMLLLRFCHLPRMFYVSRSVKPKSMQAAAILHDRLSHFTFSNLLQISALTDEKWKKATLPIRYSGFGLTSLQEISNLIFVSSWAHSVHELPKRFTALELQIDVFYPQRVLKIL